MKTTQINYAVGIDVREINDKALIEIRNSLKLKILKSNKELTLVTDEMNLRGI